MDMDVLLVFLVTFVTTFSYKNCFTLNTSLHVFSQQYTHIEQLLFFKCVTLLSESYFTHMVH